MGAGDVAFSGVGGVVGAGGVTGGAVIGGGGEKRLGEGLVSDPGIPVRPISTLDFINPPASHNVMRSASICNICFMVYESDRSAALMRSDTVRSAAVLLAASRASIGE